MSLSFWHRFGRSSASSAKNESLTRRVNALFHLLGEVYGRDKLVLKAGKLDALDLMQSKEIADQVLALERIVFEDPTLEERPSYDEIPGVLDEVEDALADLWPGANVEDRLEQRIAEKMQERHEEYVKELKLQVLKEDGGPDNAQTLKKFAELQKLEEAQAHQFDPKEHEAQVGRRDRRPGDGSQSPVFQDRLALSAARAPLRPAGSRQDDRGAPGPRIR